MSVDEFAENREFLDDLRPANSNEELFKRFVEQYGQDVARGYLMAIADIQPKIKDIYLTKMKKDRYFTPSQSEMEKKAKIIFENMGNLLHCCAALNLTKDVSTFTSTKMPKRRNQ